MIKTGLPYDIGLMEEIKNNGAIVDMSNINFPGIPVERKYKTTFIFLRNTGFNVKLDFSNCNFDDKEKFLLSYFDENIDVVQNEFPITYISVLNKMIENPTVFDCILTLEEMDLFIQRNKDVLCKMLTLILSLPIYAMYYFSLNNKAYTIDDIEKCDEELISENIYHIISTNECLTLFENDLGNIIGKHGFAGPKFYTNIFNYENDKLLHAVEELSLFSILYGLCNIDSSEWKNMLESSVNLEENIVNEYNTKED